MTLVIRALDFALAIVEDGKPLHLHLVGDGVVHVDRRRVGPRRVLEAIDAVVADAVQQCDRLLEVAVGLSREPHNDVRGERNIASRVFGPLDALEIPVARVLALHRAQYIRRAGLHRQMNMIAERRMEVDGANDVLSEVARVRGGEAHALDAVDLADGNEQFGEGSFSARIAKAVHVLAEELNFGIAESGDALRLGQHRGGRARALLAARIWNHTVGAELVASFDDGDVAAVRIGARGELGVEGLVSLAVVKPGDASLPSLETEEHLGKVTIAG